MTHDAKHKTVGFIGCGNMGGALLDSIVKARFVSAKNIVLYDIKPVQKSARYKKAKTLTQLFKKADVIILAIKPQNLPDLAKEIGAIDCSKILVVSILAGTTLQVLENVFGKRTHLVRSMPNLGLQVGLGSTGICKNKRATLSELAYIHRLFACSGVVVEVEEKHLDTVTAISGSGPAYFFYLTELLIAEGVKNGLTLKDSRLLAEMTARGAAQLMAVSADTPEQWRKKVTSPGGTTEAALGVLMSSQSKKIFERAISKAINRSKELSSNRGGKVCR
jgi:pyrroline-5-carboxylate reductase